MKFSVAKTRARGTGPYTRSDLPTFKTIDEQVPLDVCLEMIRIVNGTDRNDLGGDNYKLSQICGLTDGFVDVGYRQVLLQQATETGEQSDFSYSEWDANLGSDRIQTYLERRFGTVFRSRLSYIPPGNLLDWHIDQDPSVLCRIQIIAQSGGATMDFKRRGKTQSLRFEDETCYFLNTGWTHRVTVPDGDSAKIALIADVPWSGVEKYL